MGQRLRTMVGALKVEGWDAAGDVMWGSRRWEHSGALPVLQSDAMPFCPSTPSKGHRQRSRQLLQLTT